MRLFHTSIEDRQFLFPRRDGDGTELVKQRCSGERVTKVTCKRILNFLLALLSPLRVNGEIDEDPTGFDVVVISLLKRVGRRDLQMIPVLATPANMTVETNWKGRINHTSDHIIRRETHPDNKLICFSLRDQKVDSIARRLCLPPGFYVVAKHDEYPDIRGRYFHPRRARPPRQNRSCGGNTGEEGVKTVPHLLEIGLVLCEIVTRGQPDGHEEDDLESKVQITQSRVENRILPGRHSRQRYRRRGRISHCFPTCQPRGGYPPIEWEGLDKNEADAKD